MWTRFLFAVTLGTCQLLAADCASLKNLTLEQATIAVAEAVPAGTFRPPYGPALDKLPPFCRVAGVLAPTSDSYIRFEVWLPQSGWNQKFRGVGNGGFAGSIDFRSMGGNLHRGYATAATDTGHEGDSQDASWAYKHPDKVIDFGYRAVHLTAVAAKAIVQAYYTQAPKHSYFDSCSDGGREALMEAQRFPADYDGILAGAPAYNWTHLIVGGVDVAKTLVANPSGFISETKLPAIGAAVREACDADDGAKDGLVSNPLDCRFDPSVLRCKGMETRTCLTDAQLTSLRKLHDGRGSSEGLALGGESGWGDWVIGQGPGGSYMLNYLENFLRYMVFDDPTLNVLTVDGKKSMDLAERKTAKALNAVDPDLTAFHARGGKLILYHGWYDPAIPPYGTIRYFKDVQARMGSEVAGQFVRLYMVPGMQHCFGGPGPSAFGQLGLPTAKGPRFGVSDALEAWVQEGKAPVEIIATKYEGDNPSAKAVLTRPLCPFPQVARPRANGDMTDASGFSCEAAKK